MRHTLKWSFFIGTAIAGAVLALLKALQPIRYEHLVIFSYAFVGSSVLAGYVAHKNLEKRNSAGRKHGDNGMENEISAGKSEWKKPESMKDAVRKVPLGAENSDSAKAPEYFVPASKLAEATACLDARESASPNMKNEKIEPCSEPAHPDDFSDCSGKTTKILTRDGKVFCGKLAQINSHIVLRDVCCSSERKTMIMFSRDDVAIMEVE